MHSTLTQVQTTRIIMFRTPVFFLIGLLLLLESVQPRVHVPENNNPQNHEADLVSRILKGSKGSKSEGSKSKTSKSKTSKSKSKSKSKKNMVSVLATLSFRLETIVLLGSYPCHLLYSVRFKNR